MNKKPSSLEKDEPILLIFSRTLNAKDFIKETALHVRAVSFWLYKKER